MSKHVKHKEIMQVSKRFGHIHQKKINYRLLLMDVQVKETYEKMTCSKQNERRHQHCLI